MSACGKSSLCRSSFRHLGVDPTHFIPDLSKSFAEQIGHQRLLGSGLRHCHHPGVTGPVQPIGIRATTILTDFSGYLIFVVAIVSDSGHDRGCTGHRYRQAVHALQTTPAIQAREFGRRAAAC